MIVYFLLSTTLLLAVLSIMLIVRGLRRSNAAPAILAAVALGAFVFLYGTWLFLSVYLRFVFVGAFTAAAIVMAINMRTKQKPRLAKWAWWLHAVCTLVFATLTVLYFTGTTGMPHGYAQLSWPFKHGKYIVFQGGKGLPTNLFHYKLRGAVYAMDIVKLNDFGNRCNSIFSRRLEDYAIFNDTVYSPCSGTVVKIQDDNPDNIPPEHKRGPTNVNQVLIRTRGMYVFMAHFSYRKVFVHEGDEVQTGMPLGCAGNSGFSLEPHLHIQVHAFTGGSLPWYREQPLQMIFDGHSYLLFDEVDADKSRL